MTDLTQYQERRLSITDAAETFNAALARAVQIVDAEGFMEPSIEVKPCWVYGDGEDGTLRYTVVVYGCLTRGGK